MTQTVGYYCDECRIKYVQHMCKDGLPCGHDPEQAVFVYAKNYSKGGEYIEIQCPGLGVDFTTWIMRKEKRPGVVYIGAARFYRGFYIETETGSMDVADWLASHHPRIIRAFMDRWDSHKEPPLWLTLSKMKVTQDHDLSRECEICGAKPGQPCKPDCASLDPEM